MKEIKFFLIIILYCVIVFGQQDYTVMSYNLLNYPGNDTIARNPYFRTVISTTQPHILVMQEMVMRNGLYGV